MPSQCQVVICGTSVFLMAIEAGLTTWLATPVVRVNPALPDAVGRIVALAPDAVLIERGGCDTALALELLYHGVMLIELDPRRNRAQVLIGREVSYPGGAELVDFIKQNSHQRLDLVGG